MIARPSQPLLPLAFAIAAGLAFAAAPARAERIENNVAVFSALDKVTATIRKLEIEMGKTIEFGALKVTPRICYSRPPTEKPKTTTFVEVDEIQLDGNVKRIFTGWMFAESPGLHAVEHPVFDVWLTGCQKPRNSIAAKSAGAPRTPVEGEVAPDDAPPPDALEAPRRRVRR
jgi:hypothetical protein